jgi:hypothetical protein
VYGASRTRTGSRSSPKTRLCKPCSAPRTASQVDLCPSRQLHIGTNWAASTRFATGDPRVPERRHWNGSDTSVGWQRQFFDGRWEGWFVGQVVVRTGLVACSTWPVESLRLSRVALAVVSTATSHDPQAVFQRARLLNNGASILTDSQIRRRRHGCRRYLPHPIL